MTFQEKEENDHNDKVAKQIIFGRMRPQLPNSVQNKRQGIRQGRAFISKNSKVGKIRLRAFILILIPACQLKQHTLLSILLAVGGPPAPL